jgi:hypothetical protein
MWLWTKILPGGIAFMLVTLVYEGGASDGGPMPFKDPEVKLAWNRRRSARHRARAKSQRRDKYRQWLRDELEHTVPPPGVTMEQHQNWLAVCLQAFKPEELV